MGYSALVRSETPIALTIPPAVNLVASYIASPTIGLANT